MNDSFQITDTYVFKWPRVYFFPTFRFFLAKKNFGVVEKVLLSSK